MSALTASAILLLALTALVVFTMAVENWARIVQPLAADDDPAGPTTDAPADPVRAPADPPEAPGPRVPLYTKAAPRPAAARFRVQLVHPVPGAGIPDGAVRSTPTALVVRDQETADVIAGLLFAAYAVSRRAGADRAAAWVTAAATPPSLDPARFPPGVDLRGRPARVAELLSADDAGVTWLTLRASVDIARGIGRVPVRQPTLAGLLVWWESTRSLPSVIPVAEVGRLADAVEQVRDHLAGTAWADVVDELATRLAAARDRSGALLLAPSVAPPDAEADPLPSTPSDQPAPAGPPGPAEPVSVTAGGDPDSIGSSGGR
jgi:hypothetical protein